MCKKSKVDGASQKLISVKIKLKWIVIQIRIEFNLKR